MGTGTQPLTDGTEDYPWLIEDYDDFVAFCGNTAYWAGGVYTRLECNLDLSVAGTYSQAPIAGDTDTDYSFDGTEFSGNFDGDSKAICNLTASGAYYCGLFGCIGSGGTVTNLGLENVDITGSSSYTGGLCGDNSGSISSCYATGTVTGNGGYTGGLCGRNSASITDSYWNIDTSGQTASHGGWGLNDEQMKQAASYYGWTNGYWTIDEGNDCPRLVWENSGGTIINTDYPAKTYTGLGTEVSPYELATVNDLLCLMRRTPDWDKSFILTDNIDLSSIVFNHTLIASGSSFGGSLDGNNHIISNLTIDAPMQSYVGFISRLDLSASVNNLYLKGLNIIGYDRTGGLCGENAGNISDCYANGTVTSKYCAGGFCGKNSGSISVCYVNKTISGDFYTGGFCGVNSGSISDCYATGSVTSKFLYTGGFCGANYSGNISSCYTTDLITSIYYAGGFCGHQSGSLAVIQDCFWDTEATGQTMGYILEMSSPGTIDNVQGLTTAQMQIESTYTDAGWDFANLWWINEGRDYPKLYYQPFGDLDNDSHVNLTDLSVMAAAWMAVEGDVNYNSKCELSGDISVNIDDFVIMSENWLAGPGF